MLTSLVVAVAVVAERQRRWRRTRASRTPAFSGPILVVLVGLATFTGFLLPWDQLALWAVTDGSDLSGYRVIWNDQVRFVLIGGSEVSAATICTYAIVHLALSAGLLVPLAHLARRHWPVPSDPTDPTDGRDHQELDLAAIDDGSAP